MCDVLCVMFYSTILRLIWIQTDIRLDPNQSENDKYNLISGWLNKISKRFLCVGSTSSFYLCKLLNIGELQFTYVSENSKKKKINFLKFTSLFVFLPSQSSLPYLSVVVAIFISCHCHIYQLPLPYLSVAFAIFIYNNYLMIFNIFT